jgi:hypothetical protein
MARRQTPVLRNLDDPLRVLGLLSLRSCGLVLFLFAAVHAVEAVTGLLSLLTSGWAFLAELVAAGGAAVVLSVAERTDDEHLVPSALRFYASRPGSVLYSGGKATPSRELEGVFNARRCR